MGNILLDSASGADLKGEAPTSKLSYRGANRLIGFVAVGMIVIYAISAPSAENFLCATLISAVAILPSLLWVNRYVKGIPCFPLVAGLHIFYFATPFSINHPAVETYAAGEKMTAALTVVFYLLLATIVWASIGHVRRNPAERCLMFNPKANIRRYLALLFLAVLFNANANLGLVNIPVEVVGLIRPFILGLSVISVFLMAYNFGARTLSRWQKASFLILLTSLVLSQSASLLLISTYTSLASGLAGYWLSARRIPKAAVVVVCLFLMLFQAGKYEMRSTYMIDGYVNVSLSQYPAFFGNWISSGFNSIAGQVGVGTNSGGSSEGNAENIGLLTRASLAHMLLLVETVAPTSIPYFGGESYVDIPKLLLPRFLFPDKGNISEAMFRLSVQFGVLPVDSDGTSVAWGLLPEAYANFGYVGVIGLAIVIGVFFGLLARFSSGYSVFAVRSIASIMVITCVFGMESHAAAAISTIFQSMAAVVIASFIFAHMDRNVGSEI